MSILEIDYSPTQYLEIEGDIPLDLAKDTFISLKRTTPLKVFALGFQPAKSIPEIPRWFLQKYGKKASVVLDPFAGSGTTIIESLKFGTCAYWLDYQPLSRLICRVKTSHFSLVNVLQETSIIIKRACNQEKALSTINFANKDFWFQKSVQEGLEILRQLILEASTNIQPVLWLAFAATVRKTSNMNDGMILAARRPHVEEIPERSRQDVFKYFQFYLEKTVEALAEWQHFLKNQTPISKELESQDARSLAGNWLCDSIVTSPPYVNAIDYVWASKFELHWLGMLQNDEERLNLYAREIGTERIARVEAKELGRTGNKHLDVLIEDIYTGRQYKASKGQNELRARVVFKYFNDMKTHFKSSFEHIRPGGYYCFSIGDISKICGVDIPVAKLLTELAQESGFIEIFRFHLLLKNRKLNIPRNVDWAGTIKHDTVVVLEKPVL